jgi:RNA polymerase sigma-70 factor (ECF subfamily)
VSNKPNSDFSDERRLVSGLKKGQEEAFRVLIRRYEKKLFSIAYGITLDRQESLDIVQEVFLKVYQKIHTFREEARLSTWLHRITVNLCLNWQRRWKRRFRWHHQPLEQDGLGDHRELGTNDYHPQTLFERKECGKILREGLRALSEEARAVFVLKEVEGLSYDDIAEILRIKRGTVSSRLFYARKALRASLEPYLEEGKNS